MAKIKMGEDQEYIYYLMENENNMVTTARKSKKGGNWNNNVPVPVEILSTFNRFNTYPSKASDLHRRSMELKKASFYLGLSERAIAWEVLSSELETLRASINADLAVDQSREVYANLMMSSRLCNQSQRELTDVACSIIYTVVPCLNPQNLEPKEVVNKEHTKKAGDRIAKLDTLLDKIIDAWKPLPAPIDEGTMFNCMATISGLWNQLAELNNGIMSATVMNEYGNQYQAILSKYTRLVAIMCARANSNTKAKHSYDQIAAYMKGEINLEEWKAHTHIV